jgi:curved DNA-binding protein CbpA
MPDAPAYYELLGIAPDASDEEIRAAHRRAANYWHPDRNKSPDAVVMMRHVNNARDVLLNASKKQAYNLTSRVYQKWAGLRTGASTTDRDPAGDIRRESRRWEQKARQTWEREERKQNARAEQEAREQESVRNQSTQKPSPPQPTAVKKPRRRKQASNRAWVGISVMVIVVVSGVLANISSGGIAESALPAPTTMAATSTATVITGDEPVDNTDTDATTEPTTEAESPEPTPVIASASLTPVVVIGSSIPTSISGPSLSPACSMYAGLQFYGPVDGSIISVDGNYKSR